MSFTICSFWNVEGLFNENILLCIITKHDICRMKILQLLHVAKKSYHKIMTPTTATTATMMPPDTAQTVLLLE